MTFSQSGAVSGLKVYAFTETGSYTGQNVTTDASGTAIFDKANFTEGTYKFRVDYLNGQFWSAVASIPQDSAISVFIEEGSVDVTVGSQTDPFSGIKVYLFNSAGAYLGKNATTNTNGSANFVLPVGMAVKFRADNLGYQFWSDQNTVATLTYIDLLIPYQSVTITINGTYQSASDPIAGIPIYLFTAAGTYMGQTRTTDANGEVTFNLPERGYKVRADYQSRYFWTPEFTAQDAGIDIPIADAQVAVNANGLPLPGVTVYVFTQSGAYLGITGVTGGDGRITFHLSAGGYNFRTDYKGSQYWSVEQTLIADQVNSVPISTGGGAFSFTVNKGASDPMANVSCYVFTEAGVYLGMTSTTDIDGHVVFNLADGRYKIRADYMGYQFWSDVYVVPVDLSGTLSIGHSNVEVVVQGRFQNAPNPIEGVGVYLFTPEGTYLNISQATDSSGLVVFNLPERPYKVRADYLTRQYWSPEFTAQNTTIDIPLADADVWVSWNGQPLENVPVFVFNDSGAYLGTTDNTDVQGETIFRLPAETFKFRADYLGNHYWSGEHSLLRDEVNPIDIFTGGATFDLTVLKDQENPLVGDKTYLFNSTGAYLGLSNTTDANGQVSYDLPEGTYKYRVDSLGYQFWTGLYEVPNVASDVFTIPHQDVTITVQGADPGLTPLEGVDVYLFTPSDAYLGLKLTTDPNGQAAFNLPEKPFKVRADFLGRQFWSGVFQWQDTEIDIPRGTVALHVHLGGAVIPGAKVYLFSESGAYLSWFEVTDENGKVSFLLPDRPYKFRIDYNGGQYWSDDVTAAAGTSSPVDIDLTPPTVDIGAAPSSINVGGASTLSWNATNAYSCIIEPDIGEVDVNGTYVVSPSVTTTYTITATGPGGSVSDSIEVLVGATLSDDLDLGVAFDEQQGGGGLVAESVRLLNGNVIEARADVGFASPNSMGLSFTAAYNSRSSIDGSLGYGWSHTYSATLDDSVTMFGQAYIRITGLTGRGAYYLEESPGVYKGAFKEKSSVRLEAGEYIWYRLDGSRYGFAADGKLNWLEDEKGNRLNLAYDAGGRIDTVTDAASSRVLTFNYNAEDLIDAISGPVTVAVADGVWVSFAYDGNRNLTSVTYADGSGFNYSYTDTNDIHNFTEKRNKANHLIGTWGYDDQDRCTANFSPDGKGVNIVYSSDTQVEVTDAYGTLRTYTIGDVDGRKRLTAMQGTTLPPYSAYNVIRWQYDSQMNLTEAEYGGGMINQFQNFDERGNPATVILAAGTAGAHTIQLLYHPEMMAIINRTETSVLGGGTKETIWDYDDDNNSVPNENPTRLIARIVEKGFTHDTSSAVVPYEYITLLTHNAKGQLLSVDGPRPGAGDTTSLGYDAQNGNLLSIMRPLIVATVLSSYDAAGQVGTVTDVNGRFEQLVYDGRGRVTAITHAADGSSRTTAFNTAGLPVVTTNEDNVGIDRVYDPVYGRLYRIIDPENNYIAFAYDSQGNLIEKSKHEASGTRTSRKRWNYHQPAYPGRLWKEIKADGTYTEYGYDSAGNISSVIDPEAHSTGYAYDILNRLKEVAQLGSIITRYAYDNHGNLITVTDANNNVTTFLYDDMGRVVVNTSPDTGVTAYVYDENGNVVQETDANGVTVQYIYDDLNRLTSVNFPDAAQNITYSYDGGTNGIGRLTGLVDEAGSTAFEYDGRGRLVKKISHILGIDYQVLRSLTPGGLLSSITYPSGRTIDYTRHATGKIQSVATTAASVTTTLIDNPVYGAFGRPLSMTTGSGATVNNQTGECDCLEVSNPGAPMEQVYSYDGNRNVTAITGTQKPWLNQTFTYNSLDRLTGATGLYGTIGYTYDSVGNRQTRSVNGSIETYAYLSASNRIDQISGAGDPVQYSYDNNGNVTGIGNRSFVFNQSNRLIRVTENSVSLADYVYNALGQRAQKDAGSTTTIYHYDFDDNIIAESAADGVFKYEYLYVDQARMAMVDVAGGNSFYSYLNNYLGTPFVMTAADGKMVWKADYKPFGESKINASSLVVNNFRFTGQYFDSETGLHYNYYRYYDPKTGRYLTPDPIGLAGGINLYTYAGANPVNAIDPFGLEIRVYSSDAFGVPGLNHSFVYSTELSRGIGRAGKSGSGWGDGVGDLNSPYVVVKNLNGFSESEFMRKIESSPGWNSGAWCPWLDDCHSELADAFEYAGVPYPGAPNDRVDIDDAILDISRQIWQTAFEWFDESFSDDDSCN